MSALDQAVTVLYSIFGDSFGPMEDDPDTFYMTAADGTGVYLSLRPPAASPTGEGDGR